MVSLIEIDLTKFRGLAGKLIPEIPIELKLIEYYRLMQSEDNSPILLFTAHVLKYFYKDDVVREYNEITTFFKEKYFIHTTMYFLDMLEIVLLANVDPDVSDIVFKEFKEDAEKLIGIFEIHKQEI